MKIAIAALVTLACASPAAGCSDANEVRASIYDTAGANQPGQLLASAMRRAPRTDTAAVVQRSRPRR